MSFQYVIDNAESISINRLKSVAQTVSRDGTTRSVSRGGQVWRFEVKLPDGPKWSEWRTKISEIEALDKVTTGNIQINSAGHSWLSAYQGNSVNSTGFYGTWTQGSYTVTLTTSPTTTSGYKFRAGDFIQLKSTGRVYTVAADVAYNSNTVTLHRPIIDNSGTAQNLVVGQNCTWTVICTQFPQWNIFARDQVSWSGPFVFTEVIT
jgi:hypothetical protein